MSKIDFNDIRPQTLVRENLELIRDYLKVIFIAERMAVDFGATKEDVDAFIAENAKVTQEEIFAMTEDELNAEMYRQMKEKIEERQELFNK